MFMKLLDKEKRRKFHEIWKEKDPDYNGYGTGINGSDFAAATAS